MNTRTLLLFAALGLSTPLHAQTPEDRARAAAAAARAKSADSDALLDNYVTPGMAGQSITTVDSSKAFTPDLACQKTATYLELLAQPNTTGDIGTLSISRDSDLDGSFDEALTAPVVTSGICANGIISCTPGTWDACRFFRWDTATSGALKLSEVDLNELAGCYCVNNSCGTNLVWGNIASVLKDLGGGVVGALTTSDARIAISQAAIDGPVIRYTGAQTTSCTAQSAVGATAYKSNPGAISSDASAAAQASSVFQALAASSTGTGTSEVSRSCTITRQITQEEITIEKIIDRVAGGYATSVKGSDAVTFLMGSPSDNSLSGGSCSIFDFHMTLRVKDSDRLRQVLLTRFGADDWAQIRVDGELLGSGPQTWTGTGLPPGKCEKKGAFYLNPALDLTSRMTQGDHDIWLRVAVAEGGEAYAAIDASVDTGCKTSEQLVDTCSGYGANDACRLQDEVVDGVTTFRSGVNTGLSPLPQTRVFGTGACTAQVARDFFLRERTYRCTVDLGTSAEPDLSRGAYIIDHSAETLLADRVANTDGSYSLTTRSFSMPDRGSVSACEPICKTRKAEGNTAVAPDGVTGSKQTDPTGWDYYYRTCQDSNVCPAGDGEELVEGCGCLDDFPEAAVMMQTVRLGGADMVCTSNVR
jgi:Tfp pilus assembly protein PilX